MKHLYLSTILLFTLSHLYFPTSTQAQWTGDVANHTLIAEGTPHSQRPKVVKTSDGKTFIAWIEGDILPELGLEMRLQLQLLDFEGHALWQEGGITVVEHYKTTWITDYVLEADKENNVIVAFRDKKTPTSSSRDVSMYKINQAGEQLWGEDGLYFETPETHEATPVCRFNDDNELFVAIRQVFIDATPPPRMQIHKIASDGTLLWGYEGIYLAPSDTTIEIFSPLALQTQNDGGITLLFTEKWTYGRKIKVQRFNSEGEIVWGNPKLVTTTDSSKIRLNTNYAFLPVDNGDMYVGWGVISELGDFWGYATNVHVQYINSAGERMWGEEGIAMRTIDTDIDYPEYYASSPQGAITFAGLNDAGDLIFFWQNCYGWCDAFVIGGEAITPEGTRLWGTEEQLVEVAYFGDYYTDFIDLAGICNGNAFAFHTLPDGHNPETLNYYSDFYGRKIDVYTGQVEQLLPLAVNDTVSFYHHQISAFINEQAVTVFLEYPSRDIKAQAITCDGTLANFVGIEENASTPSLFNWQISPNPTTDHTQISWDNQVAVEQILVYNSIGQQVQMHNTTSTDRTFELSMEAFQAGMYWIVLETAEGSVSRKVVKY